MKRRRRAALTRPATAGASVKNLRTAAIVSLVMLTIAVFAGVRQHEFVAFDDPSYVTENPAVLKGLTWEGARWAFTSVHAGYWIPLTWLSHMLDVELFGLDAGWHHVVNVVWHTVNTVLLFWLLQAGTGRVVASAAVAAVFGVHPLHVESVAWIAERKDVLSTFLWLLAIAAYVRHISRGGRGTGTLVLVLFLAGLMAKPMVVTLPLALLIIDFWPLRRVSSLRGPWWPAVREKLPLLALALVFSVITFLTQREARSSLDQYALGVRLGTAVVSYGTYLWRTVWPSGLAGLYPHSNTVPWASFLASSAVMLTLTVIAMRLAAARPYVLAGWTWYVITLVPVIGLVQAGVQSHADRFTYIPLVGILVATAWTVDDLAQSVRARRLAIVLGIAVIVGLALTAHRQVSYWKDSVTFWTRAMTQSFKVGDYDAHITIGKILHDQKRLTEAHSQFTAAIRLRPAASEAHYLLGLTQLAAGSTPEAVVSLSESVRLNGGMWESRYALGTTLLVLNRVDEAQPHTSEAVRLRPESEATHSAAAEALMRLQRFDEALPNLREAVRLAPGSASNRNNLGIALASLGRIDQALPHFEEAVRLDPASENARMSLVQALVRTKRALEAVPHLQQILQRNPRNDQAKILLGQIAGR